MWDPTRYRFRSVWRVDAPPRDVFDVLRDPRDYALWWPQVRHVRRLDDDTASVEARSVLPYILRFRLHRRRVDRADGVLEARITGDMEGFARWTIAADDEGTRVLYEQEVRTRRRSLKLLAPLLRAAFRANHAVMMRRGEKGLRTFLAAIARSSRKRRDGTA